MSRDRIRKAIPPLSLVSSLLIALAFIVPRFITPPGDGFAPAAATALFFLSLLSGALLLAVILVVITLMRYRELPVGHRIAGFIPLVLIALSTFVVNMMLSSASK